MTKFFAAALAALTIVSCSKEQLGNGDNNGGGDDELNTPTYATFNFNFGGASSRAGGIFDPSEFPENDIADAKVGRLQLLIFNAATQALEHNSILEPKATSKTVLLTSGKKKIFFIANSDKLTDYNTAITPATFKGTLSQFNAMNFSAGTPQQSGTTDTERKFDFSSLYTLSNTTADSEAGLPMSNTNEITYTLVPGIAEKDAKDATPVEGGVSDKNAFKIQLYYMTAKARLKLAENVLSTGDDKKPVIKEVSYSIRNLARVTNYVQNVSVGTPQSYYYSFAESEGIKFANEFDNASSISVPVSETAGNYLYVPENNHSMLTRGQASYFAIKATYEPVVINTVTYNLNTKVEYGYAKLIDADPERNYIYTTKDVRGIPAGTYFATVELLEEAAWMMEMGIPFTDADRDAAKGMVNHPAEGKPDPTADYMGFTNALSYYRVDIGDGSGEEIKYGVLRSNRYEATITNITGPGVPFENYIAEEPEEPVSAKTYINATIVPAAWSPILQNADL